MSFIKAWRCRMIERIDRLHEAAILLGRFGRRSLPFILHFRGLNRRRRLFAFPNGVCGKPIYLRGGTTDFTVFSEIFIRCSYAPAQAPLWDRFIAETRGKSAVVIDCGANIGLSAIFFAETFPGARVLAVEPDAGNFDMLCKNTVGYPNIVPIHGGVWDHAGSLAVIDPRRGEHGMQTEESDRGAQVPALTISGSACPGRRRLAGHRQDRHRRCRV